MAAIVFCFAAKAQVTVGSVIAGTGVETFGLDFNNDGTPEFDVDWGYFSYDYSANHNIWAAGTADEGWDFPMALSDGTAIDANGNWIGQGDASVENYMTEALLTPVGTSTFMGFKIGLNGSIHYGWAKVTVAGDEENGYYATVSELAYNATANAPINAGQTTGGGGSSINEFSANNITVYPNPATDVITIAAENMEGYQIFDILGKQLANETVSTSQTTVNVAALHSGVYFLRIKTSSTWITKKIVKE